MITWFLFALGAAIAQSCMNALSNRAVKLAQFSKITISFVPTGGPPFLFVRRFFFFFRFPAVGGVILSVVGLWSIARVSSKNTEAKDYKKGNLLGLSVALMASVSTNFDKLAVLNSDRFFSFGIIAGFMTVGYAAYLLIRHRTLIVRSETLSSTASPSWSIFLLHGVMLLFLIGIVHALNAYFYNSALMMGFVSYTIAIKRIGVLFGVLWGWLFFREKNISKKFLGAIIAILGILLILLA